MSEVSAEKEPVSEKSPRQWAWEFLRRNPTYRDAYAQWMQLPEGVRNMRLDMQDPCRSMPGETPMSLFVVDEPQQLDDKWHEKLSGKSKTEDFAALSPFHPKKGIEPLAGENLREWNQRTRDLRQGTTFTIGQSLSILPKEKFGIERWIDPEISPLPEADTDIFGELEFEVHAEILNLKDFRQKPRAISISEIKNTEIVLKIDVRQPVNFLKKKLQEVILEQRSYLFENRKTKFNSSSKNKNEIFMTYEGDDSLNVNGIFDKYLKILDRILNGEAKKRIIRWDPKFGMLKSNSKYAEKMKKQYAKAVKLRDVDYKKIAYFDDYRD